MQPSSPPAPLEDVKLQKIEVAGALEHVEDQLRATEETNFVYNQRISELEEELNQMNKKSKKAFRFLNDKLEKHQERGKVLQEVYDRYPEIDFMKEQIRIIQDFCKTSSQYQDRKFDPEFLREMGITKSCPDPSQKLMKSVDYLIKLYTARYKGVFGFKLYPYQNSMEEENLFNLIHALKSSMKKSAQRYVADTEKLKNEIAELEEQILMLS